MRNPQSPVQVNISSLTIVKVILVVVGLAFLWSIRNIIGIVFVAWIISSALDPLIDYLQRYYIPRVLSILAVYILFIGFVTGVIALLLPAVSTELSSIANNFPKYYAPLREQIISIKETSQEIGLLTTIQDTLDSAVKSITQSGRGIYGAAASVFGGIATFIAILVIAFYMTVEKDAVKKVIKLLSPAKYQPYLNRKLFQIQRKLSSWMWGQLVLMVFVGVLTGISMSILGVKYPLVLGLLAGLTEFIPIIGPVLAAIPAIFFAFTDFSTAPYKPFIAGLLFLVIQQVENQFLVPRIMNRAVGLNPIVVMIALLIGAKIGGLVGVILSIPLVTILSIFLEDFFEERRKEQNRLEN